MEIRRLRPLIEAQDLARKDQVQGTDAPFSRPFARTGSLWNLSRWCSVLVAWASRTLDAYLKQRLAAGAPVPLSWAWGQVIAVLQDRTETKIRGWIAPPFGFYRGSAAGRIPRGTKAFTMVYLPAGRLLGTFKYAAHCKALASDLARIWVRWDGTGAEPPSQDPGPIVAQHRSEMK